MQFAEKIKRGWQACKRGIGTWLKAASGQPRRSKQTHSDGPIPYDSRSSLEKWMEQPDGLPPGLPGSAEIRRLADVLAVQCPLESVHSLIQVKDYTACHELAGFHEAIQSLRDLADNVDAANEEAEKAAQAAGP